MRQVVRILERKQRKAHMSVRVVSVQHCEPSLVDEEAWALRLGAFCTSVRPS